MLLAERLRMLRAQKDWSMDELGAKAGVSRMTIHRLEHGAAKVSIEVVMDLAYALGVSLDYLTGMDTYTPTRQKRAKAHPARPVTQVA
jgi:transcriptional regulator with XRE-family HTH domain